MTETRSLSLREQIYETALRSIANNSCCTPCREAALVAQSAINKAKFDALTDAERSPSPAALDAGAFREIMRRLVHEVSGLLGIIEPQMREAAGHTNINVLVRRLEEARVLLADLYL